MISHGKKQIWLTRITLMALVMTFFVIGLGALTRLTDSGLGCPDWPGCYGHMMAPLSTTMTAQKAWMEMIHRYFAGFLGITVMLASIFCLFQKGYRNLGLVIVALVIYQAILGMWTVTLKLWPIVVSQHLLGGMSLFALLWILYLKSKTKTVQEKKYSPTIKLMAIVALFVVFFQVALGAWVSSNYAALSCPHFPHCMTSGSVHYDFIRAFNIFTPIGINYEGGTLDLAARQTIQMTHRFGALVTGVYLMLLSIFLLRTAWENAPLRRTVFMLLGILLIQLLLGFLNIWWLLPLSIAVMHNLAAALLLAIIVIINFYVLKGTPNVSEIKL